MTTAEWLGPFCAFLSSCTWALGSGAYSRLSEKHSAFSINFTRSAIALPMFLLAAGLAHGWASAGEIQLRHFGWLTLSMLASYGLADVIFLAATRDLGVPGALSVASVYPIWTLLLGVARGEKLLAPIQLVGLVLTLVAIIYTLQTGVRVRATSGATPVASSPEVIRRGVFFATMTSALWAVNTFSVAQGASDLPVHWVNVIRMGLALVLCAGMGWWRSRKGSRAGWRPWLTRPELKGFAWVFPLEAFGGSLFFAYGLAHSPLVLAATLSSLAPVISVPLAWLSGAEQVSLRRAAGVLGVTAGLYLLLTAG
jgi:drug/metabolite transporter (DMT)-like permease